MKVARDIVCAGVVVAFVFAAGISHAGSDELVGNQMRNAGVERCIEQWDRVGRFLAKNTRSLGSHTTHQTDDPDGRMANAVVEENFSDGSILAVSSISPTVGGGCDVTLVRINTTADHCFTRASQIEGGQVEGTLTQRVLRVSQPGATTSYMLPSIGGEDCTMVSVETMYVPMDD